MTDVPACAPPTGDGQQVSPRLVALAMAHRRMAGRLLAPLGLHPGQERLLFMIADGPRALGDLAAQMSVNPPTVTKMVGRLEAADLVDVQRSPDDGRVRLAALTDRGRVAVEGATAVWDTLERTTTGGLTTDERATLVRLMDRCLEQLCAPVRHDDDPAC